MNKAEMLEIFENSPIIAAAVNDKNLREAAKHDCRVVFVLYGDILTLKEKVEMLKAADKKVFVHIDMIEGLTARDVSVEYIKRHIPCDGIISTKPGLTRKAKELGLLAIQRIFLLDSKAIRNVENFRKYDADFIDVLPGLMPKIIKQLSEGAEVPIITGGLISTKEDVIAALSAGAVAISSTNESVWEV